MRSVDIADCGILRCWTRSGVQCRIACARVVDYAASDDPLFVFVELRGYPAPVLVRGSLADMDRAYSAAAVSLLPRPVGALLA